MTIAPTAPESQRTRSVSLAPRAPGLHATVAVACCLFGHLLVVLDDAELYDEGRPLPLHHVRALVRGLKRPLFEYCWVSASFADRAMLSSNGARTVDGLPLWRGRHDVWALSAAALEACWSVTWCSVGATMRRGT